MRIALAWRLAARFIMQIRQAAAVLAEYCTKGLRMILLMRFAKSDASCG
jgi:hypothetical protein